MQVGLANFIFNVPAVKPFNKFWIRLRIWGESQWSHPNTWSNILSQTRSQPARLYAVQNFPAMNRHTKFFNNWLVSMSNHTP